jgi:hypothetical protein
MLRRRDSPRHPTGHVKVVTPGYIADRQLLDESLKACRFPFVFVPKRPHRRSSLHAASLPRSPYFVRYCSGSIACRIAADRPYASSTLRMILHRARGCIFLFGSSLYEWVAARGARLRCYCCSCIEPISMRGQCFFLICRGSYVRSARLSHASWLEHEWMMRICWLWPSRTDGVECVPLNERLLEFLSARLWHFALSHPPYFAFQGPTFPVKSANYALPRRMHR